MMKALAVVAIVGYWLHTHPAAVPVYAGFTVGQLIGGAAGVAGVLVALGRGGPVGAMIAAGLGLLVVFLAGAGGAL